MPQVLPTAKTHAAAAAKTVEPFCKPARRCKHEVARLPELRLADKLEKMMLSSMKVEV
jgi:hypothetical protein